VGRLQPEEPLSEMSDEMKFQEVYQAWIDNNGSRSPSIKHALEWAWSRALASQPKGRKFRAEDFEGHYFDAPKIISTRAAAEIANKISSQAADEGKE